MSIVGRGAEQFTVRFPEGLRDRIKAAADANNRSMNAEIVATLAEKYPQHVVPIFEEMLETAMRLAPDELDRFMEAFIKRKLESGDITEKDIEDGLVPGMSLRAGSKAD